VASVFAIGVSPVPYMMDFFSKCVVSGLIILAAGPLCAEILVPVDAEWKYLDDGSDLGIHWTQRDFADDSWAQGPAPLGYGGRGELTAVGYGPDSNNKYITTYFRQSFSIADSGLYTHLRATLLCDDGAIVYLNGIEILRENMPQGAVNFKTLAAGRATGNTVIQDPINVNLLVPGQNILAAEVHQWRPGSSDMRFELTLEGAESPTNQEPEPVTIVNVTPAGGTVEALPEVTVTFNRSVWGVDASDLLVNGLAATAVHGRESVYTFTLPLMREGTIRMAWAGEHGIVGSGSPPVPFDAYATPAVWSYSLVDSVVPRVATLAPPAGVTLSFLDEIRVEFSEPVGGVDASDLLLAGTAATSVRGSGAGPYRFRFDAQPVGTLPLRWAPDHGIHDFSAATHALLSDTWSYHVLPRTGDLDPVVINEIMYHPSSERTDEEYLELLNIGTRNVDLTGWQLKRGVDFTFPNRTLAPGAYLVVAADVAAFAQRYPLVTPVVGGWEGRLSNSGETLVLVNAAGEKVDLVRYADEGDWALRRRGSNDGGHRGWEWFSAADGGGCSLELCNPYLTNDGGQNWGDSQIEGGTPGQENTCARPDGPPLILDVQHDPVIPTSTETVTIRAQIVDELPTWQTQVVLYYRDVSGERDHTLLQAVMFDDGVNNDGEAQDGVFATVLPPMPHTTVIEFYVVAEDPSGQIRTWPAAAHLEDGSTQQMANALFQVDDAFYAGSQPVYRLIMTELERAELESINRSSNAQMNATLITEEAGTLNLRYNVGVRIRGAGSRNRTPTNYRVNVPSDRPWNGVQELNLNTQYTHAQLLGSVLSLSSGLPAANVRAIQVRVNGEKLARGGSPQYGSYVLTEVLNGDWAQNHFPLDGGGNTYACRRPNTDLSYLGTDPNRYLNMGYHKTSHASENDWQDLITLTEILSYAPTDTYVEQVLQVADVQEWMTYFAVLGLLAYGETALGTGVGDDYNMVRGVADPRFRLLPHDLDTVLGQGDGSSRPYNADIYGMERIDVLRTLMREPTFRALYHAELRRLMDTVFSSEQMNPLVDRYLGEWVPADVIADIKQFVMDRTAYVASILPPSAEEVRATVAGEPPAQTFLTQATLTVGGDGITHYRYKLNGGDYSPERAVSQDILLDDLPEGTYTVYVSGGHASGQWQDDTMPTVSRTWTVTSSLSRLVINEVLAKNDTAVSHRGRFVDLIELYNAGDTWIDLTGMSLSDDPADPRRFVFPAGTVIEAGAYLLMAADDPDGSADLYTGFSLDRNGEAVYLYTQNGQLLDAVVFGPQLEDWSIGRLANGHWGLTYPTMGFRNRPAETGSVGVLKINEWLASGDDAHPDDFVELHNPQPFPADLGGLVLTDNPIGVPTSHRITPLSFVEAGGFVTFIADGRPERGALHVDFKLAAEQGMIGLLAENLEWLDAIIYEPQHPGISQGRTPDGAATIRMQHPPTPGQANVPALGL